MAIKLSLKQVMVNFNSSTDTTLFVKKVYKEVKSRGLMLTDLNLIHCAMIHYQSRFKTDISKRFQYTYLTIEPSLLKDKKYFYFDDGEKSELQTQSSEVIGVGFAIALFQKLFDVNFNCINEIINTGKRCDFEIYYKGKKIIAESKGRKGNLNQAANEITNQKTAHTTTVPKYGAISIIGRDANPTKIEVVDPPSEMDNISRYERILSLLIYYTKVAQLSGYSQLASILNVRINEITKNNSKIDYYELKEIEYKNDLDESGYEIFTNIGEYKFCTFFHSYNNNGFKFRVRDDLQLFFGMDENIKKYLEDQNFEALLNFNGKYNINFELTHISIHNDGTSLILIDDEEIEKSQQNNKIAHLWGNYNLYLYIEK
ncbi:hypothetical protein J2S78_003008 [Salibacterium salarium]|uniref:hypothetical protein n=1 Tax=Salibacterium salarium TaxID=284579 RepID=UPI002784B0FF|nr:hypothetical protein [Salibacterium salarium]MDQ0300540.1 hypothetical protein [Salibacterium salarium]